MGYGMTQGSSEQHDPGPDTFQCYGCGRIFAWKPEISGRSLQCACGSKVRCPELNHDDEMIAPVAALDDTVADIELEDAMDSIDAAEEVPVGEDADVQELFEARWRYRGVFGLSLGGEVLFYGGLSIAGIACAILAAILGRYFWWWIAAAVIVGPVSWILFYRRWRRWSAGRTIMQALEDAFGLRDEQSTG